MIDLDLDEVKLDIHHIFPKKWCQDHGIPQRVFDAIVNKTAISYKANRMIGGKAPSHYLSQIQRDKAVQLDAARWTRSSGAHHRPRCCGRLLRSVLPGRKAALLGLVERAMGKQAVLTDETTPEDPPDSEEGD